MPIIDLRSAFNLIQDAWEKNGGLPKSNPQSTPLAQASGRILARAVQAPLNHPPFDQSLRDGVAIRFPETDGGETGILDFDFRLKGTVLAGQSPLFSLDPGEAAIVMTGATAPSGTDAVVMAENIDWISDEDRSENASRRSSADDHSQPKNRNELWLGSDTAKFVRIRKTEVDCGGESHSKPRVDGRFILKAGSLFRTGDELLPQGMKLTPRGIGLAASANVSSLECFPKPKVAIMVTGDEVLPLGSTLKPGSIYNSNGSQLENLAKDHGCEVIACDQIKDDQAEIQNWLKSYLGNADVILTTGGVSVGTKDLLPSSFENCGVKNVFHGVRMKPGKPIWFGSWEDSSNATYVFGLPGNPVGAYVGYHLFVRTILKLLLGESNGSKPEGDFGSGWRVSELDEEWNVGRGGRAVFWPGRISWRDTSRSNGEDEFSPVFSMNMEPDRPVVVPVDWKGSPDLKSVAQSNCLIFVDPNSDDFPENGKLPKGCSLKCLVL